MNQNSGKLEPISEEPSTGRDSWTTIPESGGGLSGQAEFGNQMVRTGITTVETQARHEVKSCRHS
jgi:hypothetical protein